jgi:hypothetical protein
MTTDHKPGTREWAEAMARAGHRVRRVGWWPHEWVTFADGKFVDDIGESWSFMYDFGEGGWSLFEEAPEPDSLADLARRVAADKPREGYYVIESNDGPMVSYHGNEANGYADALKIRDYDDALGFAAVFTAIYGKRFERWYSPRWKPEGEPDAPVPAPPTLTIGGQYRTRGGWRCVVVDMDVDEDGDVSVFVWHGKYGCARWHQPSGSAAGVSAFDIIGPWEGEE